MSGNPKITVGSVIPLTFSTSDAKAGLKVVASIVDCFGKQIARQELNEVAKSIYVDMNVQMPDVPFVMVQYFCDDEKYEVPQERFDSQPKPSEEKFIEGEVTKTRPLTGLIIGEVQP